MRKHFLILFLVIIAALGGVEIVDMSHWGSFGPAVSEASHWGSFGVEDALAYWQVTSSRCSDLYSLHFGANLGDGGVAACWPYGWDARWFVWWN